MILITVSNSIKVKAERLHFEPLFFIGPIKAFKISVIAQQHP